MSEQDLAVAKYDYTAEVDGELTIRKNDRLTVLDDRQPWWKVQNDKQESGYVPSNYLVRKDSTKGKKNIIDNLKGKLSKSKNRTSDPMDNSISESPRGSDKSKVLMIAIAKFKYIPQRDDEIEMNRGDTILVLEIENDGWWRGENSNNKKEGWFPYNYVEKTDQEPDSQYADPSDVVEARQIICKVRTMYQFNSQSAEELSFEKDAVLDIIDKPKDDPDWWQARKSSGETGLVPRNYVEELVSPILTPGPDKSRLPSFSSTLSASPTASPAADPSPSDHFLSTKDWYHGAVSRSDCERLLNNYADNGEFLVRNSESKVRILLLAVLSVNDIFVQNIMLQKFDGNVIHFEPERILKCSNEL